MEEIKITDIKGVKIGHVQNREAITGCSVAIFEDGAVTGVDVRGGAPGTREIALLKPDKMVEKIHAIMLAGGSAFGLDAASGVVKYLEEKGIGFDVGLARVPIVSSAILFDLNIGSSDLRPDLNMGYQACLNASSREFSDGNIGAGFGATVGKFAEVDQMMKGGLGTAAFQVDQLKVAAMVVVNCLGDVINPVNGEIIAGALKKNGNSFADTEKMMISSYNQKQNVFSGNTSLGIVITNAKLNKVDANKVAVRAHNGYAQTMSPAHSEFDGDTIFVSSTANINADINVVNLLATKAVKKAVINAVTAAETIDGVISYTDLQSRI